MPRPRSRNSTQVAVDIGSLPGVPNISSNGPLYASLLCLCDIPRASTDGQASLLELSHDPAAGRSGGPEHQHLHPQTSSRRTRCYGPIPPPGMTFEAQGIDDRLASPSLCQRTMPGWRLRQALL